MKTDHGRNLRILLAASALAGIAYLILAWFILPPQAFWSPDEGAKLWQTQSLRWQGGRLAYDLHYAGKELDPSLEFALAGLPEEILTLRGGRLYFQRLPLFSLMVLPFYRLLGVYGLYLLPALGGALTGLLALLWLSPEDRRVRAWLLIAFGSPVIIYAALFWEHTLATSLALSAALLAIHLRSSKYFLGWALVGIVLGLSIYMRQEIAIFALAFLTAYGFLVRERRGGVLLAAASLAAILLPYTWLHQLMFAGQPVPDNARYLFYPFAYLSKAGFAAIPDLLIGPETDDALPWGWLGTIWSAAALIAVAAGFGARRFPQLRRLGTICLGITAIAGIAFLFTSANYRSAHGLLLTAPWVLLGVYRAPEVWQRAGIRGRLLVLTTLLGLAGYITAILIFRGASPQGGPEWGARFALTFFPLLAIIALWDWDEQWDQLALEVVWILVFLGFAFQGRGLWRIEHDKEINAQLNRSIQEAAQLSVVSDLWWLPLHLTPVQPARAAFITRHSEDLGRWVTLAGEAEVRQFLFVTLNPDFINQNSSLVPAYHLTVLASQRIENLHWLQIGIETP